MTSQIVTLPAAQPLPLSLPKYVRARTLKGLYVHGERLPTGEVVSVQVQVREQDCEISVCVDGESRFARRTVPAVRNAAEVIMAYRDVVDTALGLSPSEDDEDEDYPVVLGSGQRLPDPTTVEVVDGIKSVGAAGQVAEVRMTVRVVSDDGDGVAFWPLSMLLAHSWRQAHLLLQAA